MLSILLLAAAQAASPAAPATAAAAGARASIRILRGARVESGRTDEPHSRGKAQVVEASGARRTIDLVEFQ